MIDITILNVVVLFMAFLARFEKYRFLLAWAFLLLAFVLGIRYGYGNDYTAYRYIFVHGESEESQEIELGWLFLITLFRPIGFNGFVFVLTLIEHIMLWDIIRRHVTPNYYWLAVFIYLFNPYFMLIGLSMMRQFLVQILGFYAMEYAYKRKYILFVLIVIVCVSIHSIGYLLIPLILLPWLLKSSSSKSLLILSTVIFLGVIYITIKMDEIIDNLIKLFAESNIQYGNRYLNDNRLSEDRINPKLLIRYGLYVVLLGRTYKFLPNDNPSKFFAVEVMLGLFFIPFAALSPLAVRVSWIYSIVVIISMPVLINYEKVPIIKFGIILMFSLLLFREYQIHFFSEIYRKYYMNFHTIF